MKKLDLRRELKNLYTPSAKEVELVKVPNFSFLMIDGQGDPNNSKVFENATQALYSLSYSLKFKFKFERKIDYPVMALEGLWWMGNNEAFDIAKREYWNWTLMILQPKMITKAIVGKVLREMKDKKGLVALDSIRLEAFNEGSSIQTMYIGPYAEDPSTLQRMQEFARDRGLQFCGKHHEVYMSDPSRVKSEKMKTILRHPVKRSTS